MSIIQSYAIEIHELNKRWWCDLETGEYKPGGRDRKAIANLFISEVSELFEGVRKNLQSTKIPEFTSETEELADLIIRVFDAIGGYGLMENPENTRLIRGFKTLNEWQESLIVNQPRDKQHDIYFLTQLCILSGIYADDDERYLNSLVEIISQSLIYAAAYDLPVIDAIGAKLIYNKSRSDHKLENRRGEHGKKF